MLVFIFFVNVVIRIFVLVFKLREGRVDYLFLGIYVVIFSRGSVFWNVIKK